MVIFSRGNFSLELKEVSLWISVQRLMRSTDKRNLLLYIIALSVLKWYQLTRLCWNACLQNRLNSLDGHFEILAGEWLCLSLLLSHKTNDIFTKYFPKPKIKLFEAYFLSEWNIKYPPVFTIIWSDCLLSETSLNTLL